MPLDVLIKKKSCFFLPTPLDFVYNNWGLTSYQFSYMRSCSYGQLYSIVCADISLRSLGFPSGTAVVACTNLWPDYTSSGHDYSKQNFLPYFQSWTPESFVKWARYLWGGISDKTIIEQLRYRVDWKCWVNTSFVWFHVLAKVSELIFGIVIEFISYLNYVFATFVADACWIKKTSCYCTERLRNKYAPICYLRHKTCTCNLEEMCIVVSDVTDKICHKWSRPWYIIQCKHTMMIGHIYIGQAWVQYIHYQMSLVVHKMLLVGYLISDTEGIYSFRA